LRRSGRAKEKLQGVLATSKKDIYPEYFPQQLSFLISFSINHPQNTYNASNTPYKTSTTFIMQFSAVTFIAFVVTGVVAAPAADEIFARANCNDIVSHNSADFSINCFWAPPK
tara:strand:- start:935 stop:1273 length:339 start_codon:yes stop_codon:yes gene_type:complete